MAIGTANLGTFTAVRAPLRGSSPSSPPRAAALLHPLRLRILEALREPDSAAGLARRLRLPRQKVNYHVRELARARFLSRAGQRRRRNMIEQRYVATARGYVLAPEILGRLNTDPRHVLDAFSAAYLLALAAKLQSELGRATEEAAAQNKRLTTLSLSSELRFENAEQRATLRRRSSARSWTWSAATPRPQPARTGALGRAAPTG